MAVKRNHNGYVDLIATETVVGVLLNKEIQNGVKIRPTNVTANIAATPHLSRLQGQTATATVIYPGLPVGGASAGTPAPATITISGLNAGILASFAVEAGDRISIGTTGALLFGFPAGVSAFPIRGTLQTTPLPTATSIVVVLQNTNNHVFPVTVTLPTGAGNIQIVDFDQDEDTDYILLHNGPKGGFSQQFQPSSGGTFRVNSVIQAVITTS